MEGKERQNDQSQTHTCLNRRRQRLKRRRFEGEKVKEQYHGAKMAQKVETCDENKYKYLVAGAFLF